MHSLNPKAVFHSSQPPHHRQAMGRTVVGNVHAVEAQQDGSSRHLLADGGGGVCPPNAHTLLAGLHFTPPSCEQADWTSSDSLTESMQGCRACVVMRSCDVATPWQSLPV